MEDDTDHALYKRRLEAARRAELEKEGFKGKEVDDLLGLDAFLEKIKKIDLGKLAEEKLNKLTEKQRAVHDLLSNNPAVDRRIKQAVAKPKKRKKLHWKTKEKRRKDYYQKVVKPKLRERKAKMLDENGWFPLLQEQWKRAKLEVELTEDQWNEHIAPWLGDSTPQIHRYDPTRGISLANIWITTGSRTVFDGVEFVMKSKGYIL